MDDLRRRMLLRQIREQNQSNVEGPSSPASSDAASRTAPTGLTATDTPVKQQAPEPLASEETLARINAAKNAATKARRVGVAIPSHAATAVVEKSRETKANRSKMSMSLGAYKKVWIWGFAMLTLSGAGAWWWAGQDRAPVPAPVANEPASTVSPVPAPVVSPDLGSIPTESAPAVEPPQATQPDASVPMPVVPAGGGQLDAADIQRRAREERELERAAKAAAEHDKPVVVDPPDPSPPKHELRELAPAAKPRVQKPEPVRPGSAKPVEDQQAKVEDWFKRLEQSRNP